MAFLGMLGTGDFTADERPQSWREGILFEYPNGVAPLTAILSKMASNRVDDTHYHWWTQKLPDESATITGIYTDVALATAYVNGTAVTAEDIFYLKMSAADESKFRAGVTVYITLTTDTSQYLHARVDAVNANGASSYLKIIALEAVAKIDGSDYVEIIGTSNAQGADRPTAQTWPLTEYDNYTQIFRDSTDMTRTAMQTRLRTADSRRKARREALQAHAVRMEKAMIFGQAYTRTGTNGQPETFTRGIVPFVQQYAPQNWKSFTRDNVGTTWLSGGDDWLDGVLETIFSYGNTEKLALCGAGVLTGLSKLAKANGVVNLVPRQVDYGLQIVEWITDHGILYLMSDPIFTQYSIRKHSMLITQPNELTFKYLQDTIFKGDEAFNNDWSTTTGKDGLNEEFLTEAGLGIDFPDHHGYLENIGQNG